jgi:hypothetical protein
MSRKIPSFSPEAKAARAQALAERDAAAGWNDFLPAAYVEVQGAGTDPENNAYYM